MAIYNIIFSRMHKIYIACMFEIAHRVSTASVWSAKYCFWPLCSILMQIFGSGVKLKFRRSSQIVLKMEKYSHELPQVSLFYINTYFITHCEEMEVCLCCIFIKNVAIQLRTAFNNSEDRCDKSKWMELWALLNLK